MNDFEQFIEYRQRAQLKIGTLTKINNQLQIQIERSNRQSQGNLEQYKNKAHKDYQELRALYLKQFNILKEKLSLYDRKEDFRLEQIKVLKNQLVSKEQIIATQNKKLQQYSVNCIECPKNTPSHQISKWIEDYEKEKEQNMVLEKRIKKLEKQLIQMKQISQKNSNQLLIMKQSTNYSKTEADYYKAQNEEMKEEIELLKNKIKELQEKNDFVIQEENNKWWKINQNLLERIKALENQSTQHEEKFCHMFKENQKMKEALEKQRNNCKNYIVEIGWYKQLLEEAKGDFICNQLAKENEANKLEQQKIVLAKENRKLREQIANLKQKQNSISSNKIYPKNSKIGKSTNLHNKSRSPFKATQNCSQISVADFDKEIHKGNKTPDKFGSMPSSSKCQTNIYKQRNRQTLKN